MTEVSGVFVHQWWIQIRTGIQGLEHVRWWKLKDLGKTEQIQHRQVTLPVLDITDIGSGQADAFGKLGLCHPESFPARTDRCAQQDQRGLVFLRR